MAVKRPKLTTTNSEATDPAFIKWVIETYADDFNGYRVDILGMKDEPWQNVVGSDLMNFRRVAVQAGHGIGKTGFAAAAIHWFLGTRPHPAINATANTETQLSTKLWRELAKVNRDARNRDWFEWSATKFSLAGDPTAFAVAIPWNESNPEAFAGTHEEHVLGVFDEASAIPPVIWTTFSGAMSTDGARWLAIGNPTQNSGHFYEACNGRFRWRREGDELLGRWKAHTIGSPDSSLVSRAWVEEQRHSLGEDSDEFRVRVLGQPPRLAPGQFISHELVESAIERKVQIFDRWPLVLGVDVARQGGDRSAIVARRGNVILDRIHVFQNLTLKQLAHKVADEINYYREEFGLETGGVFIEGGGSLGWGVIEELWELGYPMVQDVNPGAGSSEPERFVNKRCEMWGYFAEWFESRRVHIPRSQALLDDIVAIKRKPDAAMKLRLISKDEIRSAGGRSPDVGDAAALTFAAPVSLRPVEQVDRYRRGDSPSQDDPLAWMAG
ncbi:MAG: hypothetical protein AB7P02_12675 [Alphaproteobacteria bacterium]